MDQIKVFLDDKGEWRWHRQSENGKIVATSGEGYKHRMYCVSMAHDVNREPYELTAPQFNSPDGAALREAEAGNDEGN